jgi:uncharacterized protein YdeI (YjbR/CyaY-like superfamily)
MPKKDPRIDAYIAKASDFAKPILKHIRKLVHTACPQVEETVKWNMPFFTHNGILVAMGAFKEHCAFVFWKRKLIFGKNAPVVRPFPPFGRITSLADLPADKLLLGYIRKAVELNEADIKKSPSPKRKVTVPDYFQAALKKNQKALATFEKMSPSHKGEYVEWVADAKREETRARRIKKALKTLGEGKSLHWKYQ